MDFHVTPMCPSVAGQQKISWRVGFQVFACPAERPTRSSTRRHRFRPIVIWWSVSLAWGTKREPRWFRASRQACSWRLGSPAVSAFRRRGSHCCNSRGQRRTTL